jgi:hypothetical protein
MAMTPQDAKGAGVFFGWLSAVVTIAALAIGVVTRNWAPLLAIMLVLGVIFGASLLMSPLVWLLAKLASKDKVESRRK